MKQSRIRSGLVSLAAMCVMVMAQVSQADDYASGWGPEVGSVLPVLEAKDQAGENQNLQSLAGEQGLLLFLNRSADW
ncbi:MAG: hypothetical protein AAF541_04885 [Pseudomonadota bacterium]